MRLAEIQYACANCQTVRLHFIHESTLRSGFATYVAKAGQLNFLCDVGKFGQIWPSGGWGVWGGGAHEFHYT